MRPATCSRAEIRSPRLRSPAAIPSGARGTTSTFFRPWGAIFATEATRVTEEMFIVAAQAVAEQVTEENLSMGLIYPPQSHILNASLHVAERIAGYIFDQALARVPRPDDVGALVRARAYRPLYAE